MKRKALFLDRDGVINVDRHYVYKIKDFEFIDGVLDFIKEAQKRDYFLVIVTNQSGIGRGYYTLKEFFELSDFMIDEMRKVGIDIREEQIFFCPHSPESNCQCRKPKPKMILDAKEKFDIELSKSIMIGDKLSDIQAGKSAGVGRNILIERNSRIFWIDSGQAIGVNVPSKHR